MSFCALSERAGAKNGAYAPFFDSALKRGQANLLPGRLINYRLGGLVSSELDYRADELRLMSYGALPEVYSESETRAKERLLASYVANYIQEEIRAEAIVRNIDTIARAIPPWQAFLRELGI